MALGIVDCWCRLDLSFVGGADLWSCVAVAVKVSRVLVMVKVVVTVDWDCGVEDRGM